MRELFALTAFIALLILSAFLTGETSASPTPFPQEWRVDQAQCPSEDSCYVDYRSDGHWYIVEGERPLVECPPYSREQFAFICQPG